MPFNKYRSSILRRLDPKSASGRALLQDVSQQEIDYLRAKFPQKRSEWLHWLHHSIWFYSAILTATLLVLLTWSLLGNAAAILFPQIEPGKYHLIGILFSGVFWTGLASSGFALFMCIHLGKGAKISELVRSVKEHKYAVEALSLKHEHQEVAKYMEIVVARRELVAADADALMAIANQYGKDFALKEEKERTDKMQQILQKVETSH